MRVCWRVCRSCDNWSYTICILDVTVLRHVVIGVTIDVTPLTYVVIPSIQDVTYIVTLVMHELPTHLPSAVLAPFIKDTENY
jgi:hypothetical protein